MKMAEKIGVIPFADVDANSLLEKPEILQELKTRCHFLRVLGVYALGRKL